uniref:Uncharacterized protein n=1 Tax=Cacopsylla melanoneura TaxID=428564 RepID=A0A8D8R0C0_9HEMI
MLRTSVMHYSQCIPLPATTKDLPLPGLINFPGLSINFVQDNKSNPGVEIFKRLFPLLWYLNLERMLFSLSFGRREVFFKNYHFLVTSKIPRVTFLVLSEFGKNDEYTKKGQNVVLSSSVNHQISQWHIL